MRAISKWAKMDQYQPKIALEIALINYTIIRFGSKFTHTSAMQWGKFDDKINFLRNQF